MNRETGTEDNSVFLDEMRKKCLDAPGYLIFTATLESKPEGMVLNFDYRRYHLNIEDAKLALKRLEEQILDDFKSI